MCRMLLNVTRIINQITTFLFIFIIDVYYSICWLDWRKLHFCGKIHNVTTPFCILKIILSLHCNGMQRQQWPCKSLFKSFYNKCFWPEIQLTGCFLDRVITILIGRMLTLTIASVEGFSSFKGL